MKVEIKFCLQLIDTSHHVDSRISKLQTSDSRSYKFPTAPQQHELKFNPISCRSAVSRPRQQWPREALSLMIFNTSPIEGRRFGLSPMHCAAILAIATTSASSHSPLILRSTNSLAFNTSCSRGRITVVSISDFSSQNASIPVMSSKISTPKL